MLSFLSRFKIRTQLAVLLLVFGLMPLIAVMPIVFSKLNDMQQATLENMSGTAIAISELLDRDEFATMFYGIVDTAANCLLYACAAVPPALVFTSTEKDPVMIDGRGFPLGTVASATYETKFMPFIHGDMLLLYSDSLVETANDAGAFLSEDQLKQCATETLRGHNGKSTDNLAQKTVDNLISMLKEHSAGGAIKDDITITSFHRRIK
jgi:serine phosphatase RsbU (regulator of sigma subunit)